MKFPFPFLRRTSYIKNTSGMLLYFTFTHMARRTPFLIMVLQVLLPNYLVCTRAAKKMRPAGKGALDLFERFVDRKYRFIS